MSNRKSNDKKRRKRVLIIHQAGRMRRALAEGWMKAGWDVFEAEGRADGLPLMFQLHPDLISLEVITGQEDSWDVLYSIRLLTLTPVVVLTDGPSPPRDLVIENSVIVAMISPASAAKIISTSKTFWKSVCKTFALANERSKNDDMVMAIRR